MVYAVHKGHESPEASPQFGLEGEYYLEGGAGCKISMGWKGSAEFREISQGASQPGKHQGERRHHLTRSRSLRAFISPR